MPAQTRLLALLQDGELEALEGKGRLRPKMRVIATLGAGRKELVQAGRLHPELADYLRLLEVRLDEPAGAC